MSDTCPNCGIAHGPRPNVAGACIAVLAKERDEAIEVLKELDGCCYDHLCNGEGDDPDCYECIAVKSLHKFWDSRKDKT